MKGIEKLHGSVFRAFLFCAAEEGRGDGREAVSCGRGKILHKLVRRMQRHRKGQGMESKSEENKSEENKSEENQSEENKNGESKSEENQSGESKSGENKNKEKKSEEEKT